MGGKAEPVPTLREDGQAIVSRLQIVADWARILTSG